MDYENEINKALLAHGAWKQRLATAIANGKSDYQVAQVQVDNHCEFGKWLYSLPSAMQASPQFHNIKQLHADFHKEAARILDMALKGKKSEAEKELASGGKYGMRSGQLALALSTWKNELSES